MRQLPHRRAAAGLSGLVVLLLAGCSHPPRQVQSPPPTQPPVAAPPATSAPADQMPVEASVGQTAPDFATETTTGRPLTLQSLRGKVVLIDYWATWCPPCKAAMPTLEALHRKFNPQGLKVVGIDMDDPRSLSHVGPVVRRLGVTYDIAAWPDVNVKAAEAYGVSAYPTMFLIDKKGVVRWTSAQDNAKLLPPWRDPALKSQIQKLIAEPA